MAALGIAVAAGPAPAHPAAPGPGPRRPNIILITLDTTRADHLGCYGRAGAATPNLDALARAGALFESAISPAPLTLPSHATIMTGLVPRRHGVRDNALFRLDPSHRTVASILRAAGYSTAAAVGASVLDRSTGIGQGFGVYDDRVRIGRRSEFNFEERAASQVTATARELLESLPAPFFLWVHYYDPHYPYVPPLPYARAFSASPYDGEIAFVDEAVGRLLEGLRAKGAEAATLVVVAGDHGESLGEHGEDRHDLFLYQATQRVPLHPEGPGRRPRPAHRPERGTRGPLSDDPRVRGSSLPARHRWREPGAGRAPPGPGPPAGRRTGEGPRLRARVVLPRLLLQLGSSARPGLRPLEVHRGRRGPSSTTSRPTRPKRETCSRTCRRRRRSPAARPPPARTRARRRPGSRPSFARDTRTTLPRGPSKPRRAARRSRPAARLRQPRGR